MNRRLLIIFLAVVSVSLSGMAFAGGHQDRGYRGHGYPPTHHRSHDRHDYRYERHGYRGHHYRHRPPHHGRGYGHYKHGHPGYRAYYYPRPYYGHRHYHGCGHAVPYAHHGTSFAIGYDGYWFGFRSGY